jgi:hypothetical protein
LGLIISDASYAVIAPTMDDEPTLWVTENARGRAPTTLNKLRHDQILIICDSDKNLGPAVSTKTTCLKAIYAEHL